MTLPSTDKLSNLQNLDKRDLLSVAEAVEALSEDYKYNKLNYIFPETGPFRRELYKTQMEFFEKGTEYDIRAIMGGNRTGKSFTVSYELALHLTGLYPKDWKGRRFKKPITAWVVTESGTLFRDSIQEALFGTIGNFGTGLLPKNSIVDEKGDSLSSSMPGVPGGIGRSAVKHVSGGFSNLVAKTYEMRREQFQAAKVDVVVLDEECPIDIFTEVITRTAGIGAGSQSGIVMLAFTPLKGLTDVVLGFMPGGIIPPGGSHPDTPNKWMCRLTWTDCPHLTEKGKEALLAEYMPHEREARTKGLPALGSGRVFPICEEDIIVKPFKIPEYYERAFGLDFGWNKTAAIWGARDPTTGVIYLYSEYYVGKMAPYVHANAIRSKGKWIRGICDPRGDKSSERDGSTLIEEYRNLGLDLTPGNNAVQAGIAKELNMMESGLLKVFSNLEHWLNEFRVYRYDSKEPNKIAAKQNDHLMDATKYLLSIFEYVAVSEFDVTREEYGYDDSSQSDSRNKWTGY